MNNYFSVANTYYKEFESYYPYVKLWDFRLLLTFLLGVVFVGMGATFFIELRGDLPSREFILMLVSEVAFLISSFSLSKYRDESLINHFNDRFGWRLDSLADVKKKRLEILIKKPCSQFTVAAKQLDEVFGLYNQYRPPFDFSVESFSNWVYSSDSKPRILTLLVFFASAIVILTVREDVSLSSLFEFYYSATWGQVAGVYFAVFVVLSLGLVSLSMIFQGVIQILYLWARRSGGKDYINGNISGYIIRDLIRYTDLRSDRVSETSLVRLKAHRRKGRIVKRIPCHRRRTDFVPVHQIDRTCL